MKKKRLKMSRKNWKRCAAVQQETIRRLVAQRDSLRLILFRVTAQLTQGNEELLEEAVEAVKGDGWLYLGSGDDAPGEAPVLFKGHPRP